MSRIKILVIMCSLLLSYLDMKSGSSRAQFENLREEISKIVLKLDSLTKNDTTIELSSKSPKFEYFKALSKKATEAELIDLIKLSNNPAVKGAEKEGFELDKFLVIAFILIFLRFF